MEGLQAHLEVRFAVLRKSGVYHAPGKWFEWDENKNHANIWKHGFDFVDAEKMFGRTFLFHPHTRQDYGERRCIGIGMIRGRTVVVIFTERGPKTTASSR